MNIAFLGTRGIPNNYGGFEQFAQVLGKNLVKEGHFVTVYSPHYHSFKESVFEGVNIVHKYCPEKLFGPFAHFIYDWICTKDAISKNFDIVYHSGYQSASPSIYWFKKKFKGLFVTNMDGLEWKRSKWSYPVKLLTKLMEKIAVNYSDYLISDNIGIKKYYLEKFNKESEYIAYGAKNVATFSEKTLIEYDLKPKNYFLIIARLEPENNIEMILDGYVKSNSKLKFIIVGSTKTKHGKFLKKRYTNLNNIQFIGSIYKKDTLDDLRGFASAYFHGHSVGGTNPSLLEAMSCHVSIIAHKNEFNQAVLSKNTNFFKNSYDVETIINNSNFLNDHSIKVNSKIIKNEFSWEKITKQYLIFFKKIY